MGNPESNLRFGIKEKGNIFYQIHFKATLKLFFNIVTVQIETLIITVHSVFFIAVKCGLLRLQPLIHACLQFRVVVEALQCEPVVDRHKIRTIRRMTKELSSEYFHWLSLPLRCLSQILVGLFSNIMHHYHTPPSLITSFAHTSQS